MQFASLRFLLVVLIFACGDITQAQDDTKTKPVKKLILDGESFLINDRPAFIMWPVKEKRQTPQPWIMYSPTLPGNPDSHEKWMHEQFIAAGIAVAGIDVGESYGSPEGRKHFSALYRELTKNRGFAAKPCLLGRSRGGLWSSSWAIKNPTKVAGLAGIYPVFDLTTYPGLKRAAPAYGMTESELKETLGQHNPIEKIDVMAKAKIPVFIIHGDVDKVVPLKENSNALIEKYNQAGAEGLANIIVVKGQGHNYFQGFFRCQELVDFSIKRAKAGAKAKLASNKKPLPLPENVSAIRDLEYSRVGDKPLLLDLYRPETIDKNLPVVIWVHGGGWKNGSKNRCPAAWLAKKGFAVASIDYRLTNEAIWPAQIDDCRASVRWLRSNSAKYKLDGDQIGVWGSSAGGHLVALMGTLDAPTDEKVSSRVQAVCDWFGPSDLLTMPFNVVSESRTAEEVAHSNGAKLLGAAVPDRPDLAKQASALHQVSADDPPFLIMHGEKDPGVPLEQSRRLHEKLKSVGSSEFHIVKGAGHGGKEFQTPEVRQIVLDFFNNHLKSK